MAATEHAQDVKKDTKVTSPEVKKVDTAGAVKTVPEVKKDQPKVEVKKEEPKLEAKKVEEVKKVEVKTVEVKKEEVKKVVEVKHVEEVKNVEAKPVVVEVKKADGPLKALKVMFVGDSGAGKTCVSQRIILNKFDDDYNVKLPFF